MQEVCEIDDQQAHIFSISSGVALIYIKVPPCCLAFLLAYENRKEESAAPSIDFNSKLQSQTWRASGIVKVENFQQRTNLDEDEEDDNEILTMTGLDDPEEDYSAFFSHDIIKGYHSIPRKNEEYVNYTTGDRTRIGKVIQHP